MNVLAILGILVSTILLVFFLIGVYLTRIKKLGIVKKYSYINWVRFVVVFKCVPESNESGLRKYQENAVVIPKIRDLADKLRNAYLVDDVTRNRIKQIQFRPFGTTKNMFDTFKWDKQCLKTNARDIERCQYYFYDAIDAAQASNFKVSRDFKEYLES